MAVHFISSFHRVDTDFWIPTRLLRSLLCFTVSLQTSQVLWWTFLLKVLSIYHKWLRTRARTYASITYKHCRVIYHSGFYLTQLLLVGCMLSLFSVVLFGIDGALVSFESLQLVCKVSVTLQVSHVVTWTPILFLYCLELLALSFLRVLSDPWSGTIPVNTVGRAYCVSSARSSSLRRQHKCQKQIGFLELSQAFAWKWGAK